MIKELLKFLGFDKITERITKQSSAQQQYYENSSGLTKGLYILRINHDPDQSDWFGTVHNFLIEPAGEGYTKTLHSTIIDAECFYADHFMKINDKDITQITLADILAEYPQLRKKTDFYHQSSKTYDQRTHKQYSTRQEHLSIPQPRQKTRYCLVHRHDRELEKKIRKEKPFWTVYVNHKPKCQ